jgi:NAD(P)-dependent dehydrogenase (short-subunit alcohol dehydrogenase family)
LATRTTHKISRRTAFVTGASAGIGAAIALALARDGFDLFISGTRLENVAETSARIEALGVRVSAIALDIRSVESVQAAFARVVERFGGVDVLVNNAGIALNKMMLDVTPAEWENVLATNVSGSFYMSQAMGRQLIEQGREGLIVNVGSTHGIVGFAKRGAYGISKAAVMHMTRMLAIEWAEHRIRVNAVAPGRVETASRRVDGANDPQTLQRALNRIPLGRFCTVEDVAEAVSYLASPQAAYITGHTLVLDGGVTVA